MPQPRVWSPFRIRSCRNTVSSSHSASAMGKRNTGRGQVLTLTIELASLGISWHDRYDSPFRGPSITWLRQRRRICRGHSGISMVSTPRPSIAGIAPWVTSLPCLGLDGQPLSPAWLRRRLRICRLGSGISMGFCAPYPFAVPPCGGLPEIFTPLAPSASPGLLNT